MLLKDILKNKSYPYIEVRILYDLDGKSYDELFGACAYENKKLISLDGDDYLLDDVVEKYKEFALDKDTMIDNGRILKSGTICLTIYEKVDVIDCSKFQKA